MSFFSNPIVLCGLIALGIILILIVAVIVCCKVGSDKEREELKALSEEIEADFSNDEEVSAVGEDNIENVLSKMQEALEMKEEVSPSFEQEQEENAIISYQELLNVLGGKGSIDVDSIELYDDELENQVEISDFNKEIIESYQNESLDREIYRFQNDYSSQPLQVEINNEEIDNIMNYRIDEESISNAIDCQLSEENVDYVDEFNNKEVELKNIDSYKKFKRTEIISPVYGIISENKSVVKPSVSEEIEEIVFEDIENNSLLDEF